MEEVGNNGGEKRASSHRRTEVVEEEAGWKGRDGHKREKMEGKWVQLKDIIYFPSITISYLL